MIDFAISRYASLRYREMDSNYQTSDAITGRSIIDPSSERLTVLFPPWHGGGFVYGALARRLKDNGSSVLSYTFHGDVLQPDVDTVLQSFTYIKDTITEDIDELNREHRYDAVDLVATSLGNVSLALVASEYGEFRNATMIVPGSNLARCMWEGSRTQDIRQQFEAQGLAVEDLDSSWDILAPKQYAEVFADKNVKIHISDSDTVIPAGFQQEMAVALRENAANLDLKTSQHGHVANILKYCLSDK